MGDGGRDDWNDAGREVDNKEKEQVVREINDDVELSQREREDIQKAEERDVDKYQGARDDGGGGELPPKKQ